VLPKLVELVDSPHAMVRKAARENLVEFSFKRFLGAFDMLDDDVRASTGALVKKIDPQTVPLLIEELRSKARTRRLRALAMARCMDVVHQVEPQLLQMLEDEDHWVRADAAALLERSDTPGSQSALQGALADSSRTVQDAAQRSLQERNALAQWREEFYDPRD
jgi:HEAT repeat protein